LADSPARVGVTQGVTQGVSLALVERIRTVDGTPVVFSRDYYPLDILNDRDTPTDRLLAAQLTS
jgi:DNA-binding GntR family transcriptional regulator